MLARFHEPQQGKILVDGLDISTCTHASLLKQVAIVGQDPFLFHATVGDNILYGRPDATQAEVEEAAKAAQVHDDIVAMPQGYDTVIGQHGAGLSGGQRQRIAIARTLLVDPCVIIFDDSTSALDADTESKIQRAFNVLLAKRTAFIIAQRISTVRNADLILLMDNGRIVARGTHDALLASSPLYADILHSQLEE